MSYVCEFCSAKYEGGWCSCKGAQSAKAEVEVWARHASDPDGICVTKDCERGCDKKLRPERKIGDLLFSDETTMVTDEKTGGKKGSKVCRYDLIPAEALAELAAAYGRGEAKYPDKDGRNWERGYKWSLSFSAMCRHAWRWFCGENWDEELGVHHLALVAWHAFALMTFEVRNLGMDDRIKVKR